MNAANSRINNNAQQYQTQAYIYQMRAEEFDPGQYIPIKDSNIQGVTSVFLDKIKNIGKNQNRLLTRQISKPVLNNNLPRQSKPNEDIKEIYYLKRLSSSQQHLKEDIHLAKLTEDNNQHQKAQKLSKPILINSKVGKHNNSKQRYNQQSIDTPLSLAQSMNFSSQAISLRPSLIENPNKQKQQQTNETMISLRKTMSRPSSFDESSEQSYSLDEAQKRDNRQNQIDLLKKQNDLLIKQKSRVSRQLQLRHNQNKTEDQSPLPDYQLSPKIHQQNMNIRKLKLSQQQIQTNKQRLSIKPSVISNSQCPPVAAFGVNTNSASVKQAKDQIAVALNIRDPSMAQYMASSNPKEWPSLKFFGVYSANQGEDFKSGEQAEFMKHNFHRELAKRRDFYLDTIEKSTNATFKACRAAFNLLREQSDIRSEGIERIVLDKQGMNDQGLSTMMVIMINEDIHVAGCGSFSTLISSEMGEKIQLVRGESQRDSCGVHLNNDSSMLLDMGVSLSSQRAQGKMQELQQSSALINVTTLKKNAGADIDFLIIASQEVFDLMGQERMRNLAWKIIHEEWNRHIVDPIEALSIHQVCGKISEQLIKDTMKERKFFNQQNISIIMIAFNKLDRFFSEALEKQELMKILKEHQALLYSQQRLETKPVTKIHIQDSISYNTGESPISSQYINRGNFSKTLSLKQQLQLITNYQQPNKNKPTQNIYSSPETLDLTNNNSSVENIHEPIHSINVASPKVTKEQTIGTKNNFSTMSDSTQNVIKKNTSLKQAINTMSPNKLKIVYNNNHHQPDISTSPGISANYKKNNNSVVQVQSVSRNQPKLMLPPLSTTTKLSDQTKSDLGQLSVVSNIRDQYQSMMHRKKILRLVATNNSNNATGGRSQMISKQQSRGELVSKVLETVLEIDQGNLPQSSKRERIYEEDKFDDQEDQVNFTELQQQERDYTNDERHAYVISTLKNSAVLNASGHGGGDSGATVIRHDSLSIISQKRGTSGKSGFNGISKLTVMNRGEQLKAPWKNKNI